MADPYYVHIECSGQPDQYLEFDTFRLALAFLNQIIQGPASELKRLRFSLVPQDSIYLAACAADTLSIN